MNSFDHLLKNNNLLKEQLYRIGIFSFEELKNYGSKQTFAMLRIFDPDSNLDILYKLEACLRNTSPDSLDQDVKNDLKAFYNSISYFHQVK